MSFYLARTSAGHLVFRSTATGRTYSHVAVRPAPRALEGRLRDLLELLALPEDDETRRRRLPIVRRWALGDLTPPATWSSRLDLARRQAAGRAGWEVVEVQEVDGPTWRRLRREDLARREAELDRALAGARP